MEIYIDIQSEEYLMTFDSKKHLSGGLLWRGKIKEDKEVFVTFIEIDGIVTNLRFSENTITTHKDVIYERVSDALTEYRQTLNEGFEVSEENSVNEMNTIRDPYNPDDIKVRKDVYSIVDIFSKINKKEIDLNPDFQRHFVWLKKQKSRLIESILLGIPLPVFYFAEEKNGTYIVVDGLQRLSTIRDFLSNEFDLTNLEHLGKYCDKKYFGISEGVNDKVAKSKSEDKSIERRFQRRIENAQLNVNIIEKSSPLKVKYDIFNRINDGGKPLNKQEIRNSLAKKNIRELLQSLAKSEEFKLAAKDVSDIRMGAQELILRFIGFYLTLKSKSVKFEYKGNFNDFLDDTNEALKTLNESEIQKIRIAFLKSMTNAYHLFGRYCFRKYLPEQLTEQRKQLLNKAIFVTWGIALCDYDTNEVKEKFAFESFAAVLANELKSNEVYFDNLTNKTSDKIILNSTFESAKDLAQKHLQKSYAVNI